MKPKPNKPTSRVTVRNIAEAAGVTIGTVSTVLNNRHVERRIPLATVEKVRATATRLGYMPDIGARRLRSGSAGGREIVVAFVTSYEAPLGVVNQFLTAMRSAAATVSAEGQRRSFTLLIEMFAAGRLSELPGLIAGDHFNAALIANTTPEDDVFLSRVHLPYPVVLINRSVSGYASVLEDPTAGSQVAELLIRSKRTRLGVLQGKPLTNITRTRVDSFLAATNRLLGRSAEIIEANSLSESAAHEAVSRFLKSGGRIDALYAVTDSLALGAYHSIKRHGLIVPRDIAVMGVGDYENAPYFDPPLSTVGVSRDEIGARASELLLQLLDSAPAEPPLVNIPVKTVLRESTGNLPREPRRRSRAGAAK